MMMCRSQQGAIRGRSTLARPPRCARSVRFCRVVGQRATPRGERPLFFSRRELGLEAASWCPVWGRALGCASAHLVRKLVMGPMCAATPLRARRRLRRLAMCALSSASRRWCACRPLVSRRICCTWSRGFFSSLSPRSRRYLLKSAFPWFRGHRARARALDGSVWANPLICEFRPRVRGLCTATRVRRRSRGRGARAAGGLSTTQTA